MSKREPGRIYIDSCVAIELAKYMMHIHRPDREEDLWIVNRMFKASEDGEVELFTSSLTVVETLHLGKDSSGRTIECPEKVKDFLVLLLTSGTLIKLVEPSLFISESARDLRWKHRLTLQPFDSLHVASALDAKCKELVTFDGKMNKLPEDVKILAGLGLKVIRPFDSAILPADYRQSGLALDSPRAAKMLPPSTIQ